MHISNNEKDKQKAPRAIKHIKKVYGLKKFGSQLNLSKYKKMNSSRTTEK